MHFSTTLGMRLTWGGAGTLWLSHLAAQIPGATPEGGEASTPIQVAASMGWPAAAVSIVGSLVTIIGIYQKINDKRIEANQTNIESVKKELAIAVTKAEIAQRAAIRLKRRLRHTDRNLKATSTGLAATRQSRHDHYDHQGGIIGSLEANMLPMIAAINQMGKNQAAVLAKLGMAETIPETIKPFGIDIERESTDAQPLDPGSPPRLG